MRVVTSCAVVLWLAAGTQTRPATPITAAGRPAELDIRQAGERGLRVTLKPVDFDTDLPDNPALMERTYPKPAVRLREIATTVRANIGGLRVEVRAAPLTITVTNAAGQPVQELTFDRADRLAFRLDGHPVLGMGEGGPRPERGAAWREHPVQFDRSGALDAMEPRWQSDVYGSRNPAPVLWGTGGWGLFVAAPWVQVDLRDVTRGVLLPVAPVGEAAPQTQGNQEQSLGKGLPPPQAHVPGLYDVFVFDAHDPPAALKDFAAITGPAAMPPKWALGYMQSHRTLQDDRQLVEIIDTFRQKQIPLDAVIYLGTGFCPRGWNTTQPSFSFNPDVFTRNPKAVIADMHARPVKVVVHMVPWDRDALPTLHGAIPPRPEETLDAGHIQTYWRQHVPLLDAGIDAFWPDEGDWLNLHERLARHRMYYHGPLLTRPNVRPWHLQRNGYPGIARWGGWVWSGDTESSWKTLEAQIAVGLNYSLSIGPYWGSDIGGFYPNRELTGELYARWFQFAAFCGSFRAHGRVWWMRLPWGWGLDDVGPREYGNRNTPIPPDDPRNILPSELKNAAIEPIARSYAQLRYGLMPYTYTLAWEARAEGLPLMRAMWLHYPADERARGLGTQYLWGRDLLIAPVFAKGASSREVYLPDGGWYDWWTNEAVAGGRIVTRAVDLATMPIYVRAGAVIPVDPARQYTSQAVDEPTTIRIYPGANGEFRLYDDDGISQAYLEGRGTWTRFTWHDGARQLTIEPVSPAGAENLADARTFRIVVIPEGTTREIRYEGRRTQVSFQARRSP
ncbi:MAG: TIM-barrel domain-containing protein [Acidobacteriota bacterium]